MTFEEAKTAVLLGNKVRLKRWSTGAYTAEISETKLLYTNIFGTYTWQLNIGMTGDDTWEIYQPEVESMACKHGKGLNCRICYDQTYGLDWAKGKGMPVIDLATMTQEELEAIPASIRNRSLLINKVKSGDTNA